MLILNKVLEQLKLHQLMILMIMKLEKEIILEIINILEKNGKINKNGIKEFIGLDRFEARKLLVKKLKEKGYLVKIENIKNKVPYGDRSNSIIEPLINRTMVC